MQVKDQPFSGKDLLPVILFSQYFKVAFDACNIHEVAPMRFFKHYLPGVVEVQSKAQVAFPTEIFRSQ